MSGARIVLTNDDGVAAEGLHAVTRGLIGQSITSVVVAPSQNRSGVGRHSIFGTPVSLEALPSVEGIPHYSCSGMPVDCVRIAMLGTIARGAELVISGINHGPNLGDDSLNSGTVGAAIEGALLGATGLAVSQQHFDDHFHILDSYDPTTPIYDMTGRITVLFAEAILALGGAPERVALNVNVPATIREPAVEVTRLGRRFYSPDYLIRVERDGINGYLTYGERDGPAPPFDDSEGTDFGALKSGRLSATPLDFAWERPSGDSFLHEWAVAVCGRVGRAMASAHTGI